MFPFDDHQAPPEPVPDTDPPPDQEPMPDKEPVPDPNPIEKSRRSGTVAAMQQLRSKQ